MATMALAKTTGLIKSYLKCPFLRATDSAALNTVFNNPPLMDELATHCKCLVLRPC